MLTLYFHFTSLCVIGSRFIHLIKTDSDSFLFYGWEVFHCIYVPQFLYLREGNGTPLQYSCLETPIDGGAWQAAVHGVAKSRTRLSDFPFTFHFHALEKDMATHSSVLAWRIPGTGEPGGLPSMGSHRVGHDWSDLAAAVFHCIYVLHLIYTFICQWTFRLLPCSSCCEQCCSELWGACVFFNYDFLRVYAQ